MKKQIMLAAIATLFGMATLRAQGGGNFQRRTPQERTEMVHQKLDSAFKMDADKLKQADDIFLSFTKTQI